MVFQSIELLTKRKMNSSLPFSSFFLSIVFTFGFHLYLVHEAIFHLYLQNRVVIVIDVSLCPQPTLLSMMGKKKKSKVNIVQAMNNASIAIVKMKEADIVGKKVLTR